MRTLADLLSYRGRRVAVTGVASGIGAALVSQLGELGAEVVGLDAQEPTVRANMFHPVDLSSPESIDAAVAAVGPVDGLFNVAGVSSGIGDSLLVVKINFLGMRQLTEALVPTMPAGASVVNVASLAASEHVSNASVVAGLLGTKDFADGVAWCQVHPDALADGGYRLSKQAVILYGMEAAVRLGPRGIRINCSAPGVTETPILDQLRAAYGQDYLDSFRAPLGRMSTPDEQAAVLAFLGSPAAGYITGQVIWADGGILAQRGVGRMLGASGATGDVLRARGATGNSTLEDHA
ncbi:MAG: coniferyl-alcohol dehydrogenase [Mycobacterium sp.]